MSQEKSPRPAEEQSAENSEAGGTLQAEIKEFRTEIKGLGAEESASALIELARQLTEKFSTLKEKVGVDGVVVMLYVSLCLYLGRAAKREDLSPMTQSKLKALKGNLLKSNLSVHKQALAIFRPRIGNEKVYRTFDELRVAVEAQSIQEIEASTEDWLEAKIPAGNGRLLSEESKAAISNLGRNPETEIVFRNMLRDLQKKCTFPLCLSTSQVNPDIIMSKVKALAVPRVFLVGMDMSLEVPAQTVLLKNSQILEDVSGDGDIVVVFFEEMTIRDLGQIFNFSLRAEKDTNIKNEKRRACEQPSEKLEDKNIFFLLGVEDGKSDEKEKFLDELQQVIWEDFLANDLSLLIAADERRVVDKILAQTDLSDLEKQEKLIEYLAGLIPVRAIIFKKALGLRQDLVRDRIVRMKEDYKDKPADLAKIDEATQFFAQGKWMSGAKVLNSLT